MRFVRPAVLVMVFFASSAHAITGAICISAKLNGALKLRASGACKPGKEIQIGSFDGTTLQFTGINVQIVSGAGATDAAVNGKGNLIVGYNMGTGVRNGSHNLIVGDNHDYTSYGGFVAGLANIISGPYASVSGGQANQATAEASAVSGGIENTASGDHSSVSGGGGNTASGPNASVSGGFALNQPATDGWAAGSATPGNIINGDFESP